MCQKDFPNHWTDMVLLYKITFIILGKVYGYFVGWYHEPLKRTFQEKLRVKKHVGCRLPPQHKVLIEASRGVSASKKSSRRAALSGYVRFVVFCELCAKCWYMINVFNFPGFILQFVYKLHRDREKERGGGERERMDDSYPQIL